MHIKSMSLCEDTFVSMCVPMQLKTVRSIPSHYPGTVLTAVAWDVCNDTFIEFTVSRHKKPSFVFVVHVYKEGEHTCAEMSKMHLRKAYDARLSLGFCDDIHIYLYEDRQPTHIVHFSCDALKDGVLLSRVSASTLSLSAISCKL